MLKMFTMHHTGDAAASQLSLTANEVVTIIDRASDQWVSAAPSAPSISPALGPAAVPPHPIHNNARTDPT